MHYGYLVYHFYRSGALTSTSDDESTGAGAGAITQLVVISALLLGARLRL
jgi:hypothetical protein